MAVHHIQYGGEVIGLFQCLMPFCDAKRAANPARRTHGTNALIPASLWLTSFRIPQQDVVVGFLNRSFPPPVRK